MGTANCIKSSRQIKMHSEQQAGYPQSEGSSVSSLSVECAETPSMFSSSAVSVDFERKQSPKSRVTEATQSRPPPHVEVMCASCESVHTVTPDPHAHTYTRLRDFIVRNKCANERHKSVLESCEKQAYVRELLKHKNSLKEIEKIDVFSPDERSTRWNEFMQFLAENKEGYEKFKLMTASVRGDDRAATVGGVNPSKNMELGDMGALH